MPDARLRRARATLPEGYQFGEGSRDEDAYEEAVRKWYDSCRVVFPPPVVMCGCDDWTTCAHPWPQLVPALTRRDVLLGYGPLDRGWRAPHENAAAQLRRREMVDGATLAPGDRPFITIGPDCQRTGDETV